MSERIPIHAFDMSCIMHQSPGLWAREKLGFGITVSATYEQPYALARRFGTLDHLTGGRIGWNIVTSYLDGAARDLGQTDSEARAKYDEYLKWTGYEGALAFYAGVTGVDLSQLDPHQPLQYVDTDSARFALDIFSRADPNRDWTPNEVARFVGVGAMGPVIVGSPATVADELERWVDEADITGFNLAYAVTPGTFVDFIDLVFPELRRRGRYWHDYDEATTLREKIYGPGQKRVRDDHPAAVYRRAMEDRAATRDDAVVPPAGR
jgi:alkanesulfonate monooxygenase SsuD/methylene tetrahydromethanopterin reductase-like flavin-dependent oxidoreductase (luciferase family)